MNSTIPVNFENVPMPTAQLDIPNVVDMATLSSIADAHAFEVWGEGAQRLTAFPVSDAKGDVRAFVFPFLIGNSALSSTRSELEEEGDAPSEHGAIYVSAQQTSQPVLRVVHYLHPIYLRAGEAQRIGRMRLGADSAHLSRIYWLGMHQEYFEISNEDQQLLYDVHTLRERNLEKVLQTANYPEEGIEQQPISKPVATKLVLPVDSAGTVFSATQKLVTLDECVPVVNWTWWCVPTAWTMAICYYDNYVKHKGGHTGYGRLVGYWFDHPKFSHNVPDFIDQLIDPATGTWRKGFNGLTDFVKKTYGYDFNKRVVNASAGNDWAWADVVKEIDAGRPFVWCVPGHATCAVGYRVTSNGKFVVIHTTWGNTRKEQREEWKYTEAQKLELLSPGGGMHGENIVIWTPDGGERLLSGVPTSLRWYVWGNQIKSAEIMSSIDGGNSWSSLVKAAPCRPGWNQYNWTPDTATDRARIRIRGNDTSGAYLAGDGSQNNFTVMPGPRPVTLKTYLVKAKTNSQGFFSAPHGLEYFAPDGYSIRAISVAVQHNNGNWHTLELSHNVDNRFWWNKSVVAGFMNSTNFFNRPVQVVVSAEHVVG